jgi:cell wall-associated NlpC family hydrolase
MSAALAVSVITAAIRSGEPAVASQELAEPTAPERATPQDRAAGTATWADGAGHAPERPAHPEPAARADAPDHRKDLERHTLRDPDRTVIREADGTWVAGFTHGARTVTLAGPERRFDEASAGHGVTSTTWVRMLDEPYRGHIDAAWLAGARTDTSPDVLEVATQYLPGAPEVRTDEGVLVAGEAAYGPLDEGGDRPVGSDWNDYQQRTATYGAGGDRHVRRPTRAQAGAMDCSGFVRMVFGVRHGVPLTSKVDGGESLPRISRLQAREAPGVVPVADRGEQVTDLDAVRPGDLVFFDVGDERRGIDHVGIYLGVDEAGGHRFISSRPSSNGPTMGDRLEPSLLDGDGLFARTFVATRRL